MKDEQLAIVGIGVANSAPNQAISTLIVRRPLRFGELRSLATVPPPAPNTVEERELSADAEAAPVLQKYLELADIALGVRRRPSLISGESNESNQNPERKRAA